MSGGYSDALLDRLSRNTDVGRLLAALDALEESSASLDRASDRRLSAELCLVRLCGIKPTAFVMPQAVQAPEQPAPEEIKFSIADEEEPPAPPEEEKAEEPAPPAPEQPAFTWEALLRKLEDVIFMGDYVMLSDPANVTGETEGDTLILTPKNESARQIIQGNQEDIRKTAEELAGRPVAVKIQGGGGDRFAELDGLLKEKFKIGG